MKTVFVLCPTKRDFREIKSTSLSKKYNIVFQPWNKAAFDDLIVSDKDVDERLLDPKEMIDNLTDLCVEHQVGAVISSDDYPGSIFASILAERCGFIDASTKSIMLCQHKYYSRCIQKNCVPEATPKFWIIDKNGHNIYNQNFQFPLLVKPVKSAFSVYANRIDTIDNLKHHVKHAKYSESYLSYFNWAIKEYGSFEYDGHCFLAEEMLDGFQVTVDGFILNGAVEILGIVDSIMFPGTISFARFEYPSQLPYWVQESMVSIVKRAVVCIGLDNTLFNVECIYNSHKNTIHIIEINPRMSSQFADLYEKVDGINSYEILFNLALGQKVDIKKRKGIYTVAASCALRVFEDKYVCRLPSMNQIEKVFKLFPDVRIEIRAQEGRKLSSIKQDEFSFCYGLINLGGDSWEDLFNKYRCCLSILEFVFN